MRRTSFSLIAVLFLVLSSITISENLNACSTFMLEKYDELIFGHNLEQGKTQLPGLIFINKRNTFKTGRTLSELMTPDGMNPSSEKWISRYGSITFSVFGKDLIDGGMNEEGLYIWEMTYQLTQNIENDSLPAMFSANWMQFILDNYSTVEEVLENAVEYSLDGFSWHFFLADRSGNCAVIEFLDGKAVVNRKEYMPVTALCNTAYGDEVEILSYFKGFGGEYEASVSDFIVPRFVRAALLLKNYNPTIPVVDYSFTVLDNLSENDLSQWSVVFDINKNFLYYRTLANPEIKIVNLNQLDFSNNSPVQMLDIDSFKEGDVTKEFQPLSMEAVLALVEQLPLPEAAKTSGGLTLKEFNNSLAFHFQEASLQENQYFAGTWQGDVSIINKLFNAYYPELFTGDSWTVTFKTDEDRVSGLITNGNEDFFDTPVKNIRLLNEDISYTMRSGGSIVKFEGKISENLMTGKIYLDGILLDTIQLARVKD